MIKIERQILFKEKLKEGKSEDQAIFEIKRTDNYCKKTKNKIKLKKLNEKKIQKIKKERNKKFKEAFKELINPRRKPDENTTYLYYKRVVNRLNEGPANIRRIAEDCCITDKIVYQILALLIKENKVKQIIKKEGVFYENT